MYNDTHNNANYWLEMLRSPEVDDRLVAVKALQHLGDEEAIDSLILALKDENFNIQKIAINALGEIANPIAVPALLECLASSDTEIRGEALSALNDLV
jgi:HEAT repeat protein